MSKPPGRPKSHDPKRALTIRVRSSIMGGFVDTVAARAAIEALVEARYSPGLRSELAKALDIDGPGRRPAEEVAKMAEKPRRPVEIKRIPPGPTFWPSGAAILPEHVADPGADSTTRLDPEIRGFTASGEPIMKPKSLARPKTGKAKR